MHFTRACESTKGRWDTVRVLDVGYLLLGIYKRLTSSHNSPVRFADEQRRKMKELIGNNPNIVAETTCASQQVSSASC